MTHEEIMRAASKNPFTKHCGIKLSCDSDGNYMSVLELGANHLNALGTVSSGVLYTMADTTGGMNCRKFFGKVVTLGSDFHFLEATAGGTLICRAQIVCRGLRTAVARTRIENKEGLLLCAGTFTYYCAAL